MLIAIGILLAQTGVTNAEEKSAKSDLWGLAHATFTEASPNAHERLAIMSVVMTRADSGKYGGVKSIRPVVYNAEFRGPINVPTPWVGKKAKGFKETKALVTPYYERWKDGQALNLPAGVSCADGAWHFDNRPHKDWGKFRCKIGGTWFYDKKGKGTMVANNTKRRKAKQVVEAKAETAKPAKPVVIQSAEKAGYRPVMQVANNR